MPLVVGESGLSIPQDKEMTQSRPIRVFLAFYLALWSPLWCTCSALAAIQSTPFGHEKLAESGEKSESSSLKVVSITIQGSCCSTKQASTPSDLCPSDRTDNTSLSPCHDQDDCDCGNHSLLLAQPASTSIVLSWGSSSDLPQVSYVVQTALRHHETSNDLRIRYVDTNRNGGAALTLYAQHILLRI